MVGDWWARWWFETRSCSSFLLLTVDHLLPSVQDLRNVSASELRSTKDLNPWGRPSGRRSINLHLDSPTKPASFQQLVIQSALLSSKLKTPWIDWISEKQIKTDTLSQEREKLGTSRRLDSKKESGRLSTAQKKSTRQLVENEEKQLDILE